MFCCWRLCLYASLSSLAGRDPRAFLQPRSKIIAICLIAQTIARVTHELVESERFKIGVLNKRGKSSGKAHHYNVRAFVVICLSSVLFAKQLLCPREFPILHQAVLSLLRLSSVVHLAIRHHLKRYSTQNIMCCFLSVSNFSSRNTTQGKLYICLSWPAVQAD